MKHPESHLKNDAQKRKVHSPFIIYVLCDQLKNDMGNAIVDTGSQVSLVIENNLVRESQIEKHCSDSWYCGQSNGNDSASYVIYRRNPPTRIFGCEKVAN